MRRWLIRILAIGSALVLLAMAGVQLVLWSNLPRKIVLAQLESQFRLRVSVGSVSTGWLGRATLRNVTFALPLADHPILEVSTVQARHTSVFGLIVGRDFIINALDLRQAKLQLVRAADGRWNFQEIVDVVAQSNKKAGGSSRLDSFPRIRISDATISIIDGPRRCEINDVTFDGAPESALTWKFALEIPHHAHIGGRLVPGFEWQHEIDAQFDDVAAWIRPWLNLPADASFQGAWRGRLGEGQVRGRLQIDRAALAGSSADGGIDISQAGGILEMRPDHLRVQTRYGAVKELTALSGSVTYQNDLIRANAVQLSAYGGPAIVSGYYDLAGQTGQIQAGWDRLALPHGIIHGGNLTASIRRPFPTQFVLEGTLFSYATTPQGPWRAQLNFGAQGDAGSDVSWHLTASELAWNRRNAIRLDGLHLTGSVHRSDQGVATIALASATLPDSKAMSGSGFYNVADRSWEMTLQGARLPIQLVSGAMIGFDMRARGNASLVELKRFELRQADSSLAASGFYRYGVPKPLQINVVVASPSSYESAEPSQPIVGGAIRGNVELVGMLSPLQVELGGQLNGRNVSVAGRWLGEVALRLAGEVNPERAELRTERLRAFDGDWYFRGTYTFAEELLDVDLRVGGLPLKSLGNVAKNPSMEGVVDGDWDAYVLSLPLSAQKIRLRGHGSIRDFRAKSIAADEVDFITTMDDGQLSVDPIALRCGAGRGTATLNWNISSPRHLDGAIALSDWPVNAGDAHAVVKLEIPQIDLDLPQPATTQLPARLLQILTTSAQMHVAARWKDRPIGELTLTGDSDGRIATIRTLSGTLLGANLHGSAVYDVDAPLKTRASLWFDELNAARIVEVVPELGGLTGQLHGAATLGPATAAHPLEPLALGMQVQFDSAHYRDIPIGLLNLNLFINTDRIVLDDRPDHGSTIQLAQGFARFWGRWGRRENEFSSQAEIQLDNLNVDQIARAVDPKIKPTPGRVSGRMMFLYTSPSSGLRAALPPAQQAPLRPAVRQFMANLYGETTLTLTHSNIATVPIISDLYYLMSLGQASRGAIGSGGASLRLENGTLHADEIRYTNRGIDARIQLDSPRMWDFPHNPVSGFAVGSAQPLAALKLPLVSDIQSALTAVQTNFTPTQIGGNWKDITTTPIAFSSIGQAMKEFLLGDIGSGGNSNGNQ
jgi:hypothetical protein